MRHLPGESNGCSTELTEVQVGGDDSHTIEFAAAVQHPFPFHGLDLCNFVRPYENRSLRFLCKFLPFWLDCQGMGRGADDAREIGRARVCRRIRKNLAKFRRFSRRFGDGAMPPLDCRATEHGKKTLPNSWTVRPIGSRRVAFPAVRVAISWGDGAHAG